MSKYNFDLDMDSKNSNSVILHNIKPNSKVLEIGCAHGRMTKYLKETLNCEITIIEKDAYAGGIASQWAASNFIGNKTGDVEKELLPYLYEKYATRYDYIIFADVLEHLYNPKSVLQDSKLLLKPHGSIWISIPNIGHNSVLIDLWNNKFEYRSVGLLDDTHIRFFTEPSLRKMVIDSGFRVSKEINLRNAVENTEFNNSFDDVPEEIVSSLKDREFADIYQFVWQLKL
jgi:2-polyprenyl-3-methyl-5-hydroxy-6-metoxy-1,4-benzoquinol methylase